VLDEDMSGEATAGGGGEANGVQPNVTIYINNLNEKIKLEGTRSPAVASSPSSPPPCCLNPRQILANFFFPV
jgi:hypothetical protein